MRARRLAAARAASSSSRVTVSVSEAFSHGLCTNVRAPRRIASTAVSMLPQPVMTMIGRQTIALVDLAEQLETFAPRRRIARVVEIHEEQVVVLRVQPIAHFLDGARGVGLETGAAQQQAKCGDDVRLIVGDQHAARDCRIGRCDGPAFPRS